jgi:hypothetical protein
MLTERRQVLDEGAQLLLAKEKIESQSLVDIMEKHGFQPVNLKRAAVVAQAAGTEPEAAQTEPET